MVVPDTSSTVGGPRSRHRHATVDSTDSRDSQSDFISEYPSSDSFDAPDAGFPRLYADATAYEYLLAQHGCIRSLALPERDISACGFADLILSDLDQHEERLARRLPQVAAASGASSWVPDGTEIIMTGEPQSYEDAEDDTDDIPAADSVLSDVSRRIIDEPVLRRATMDDTTTSWTLQPSEVVRLLIDEFGLLTEDGEQERLLMESDACLFHDVVIVGVIHLTTHRLSFHASLLSNGMNSSDAPAVIKAGPALLHRKSQRSRHRVWLELSSDMLCTYASSKVDDRIRPVRTILLSRVKTVFPHDPRRPKRMCTIFRDPTGGKDIEGIADFDTEESAIDWRRELLGALFLYRNRREETFRAVDGEADTQGIRFSLPLERIVKVHQGPFMPIPFVLSLHLEEDGTAGDTRAGFVVQMGPFENLTPWAHLQDHIAAAKARIRADAPPHVPVIDLGPLTLWETTRSAATQRPVGEPSTQVAIRSVFGLSDEEMWTVRASLSHSVKSMGHFVVTPHVVCFWSKSFSATGGTRYRVPVSIIRSATATKFFSLLRNGLTIQMEGLEDLKFQFMNAETRDEALRRVNALISSRESTPRTSDVSSPASNSITTTPSSSNISSISQLVPPSRSATQILAPLARHEAALSELNRGPLAMVRACLPELPKAINVPSDFLVTFPVMHFGCLTIGSRGDVQPYIALAIGLKREGHRVTIVTHKEYKAWIESYGITHRTAGGDPGALMKLSVDYKMFSPNFFKEGLGNFRPWLDQLLIESYEGCKDVDVLLESPSTMAGVHIAEALKIPYFRTFTMPWTRTTAFPHPFLSPPVDSPRFNSGSNVMWAATSGQINRWRRSTMNIESTTTAKLAQEKIPFIYNFSPAVVPKPLDWSDMITLSGYWFLDNSDPDWTPPTDLLAWMAQARADDKPIVYIGFGSITLPDPDRARRNIIRAVLKSGVRAVLSRGWSARMSKPRSDNDGEPAFPSECYVVDKVPHDWLFPQIDAVVHHGGAGTTGASLRAGLPTIIKPWFGDQFFWASRVQKLGAGIRLGSLHSSELAAALVKATTNRVMREKAAAVGEKIRAEDGVHTAIHTIYMYLPRAVSRVTGNAPLALCKQGVSWCQNWRARHGDVGACGGGARKEEEDKRRERSSSVEKDRDVVEMEREVAEEATPTVEARMPVFVQ
ncbi:UDP-Glycosyltransferase/glycogen phosphorylase [Fistulina hepatica ATCC 64428]|nr:UDP-Glycosyltransferase/glycogen phosphorylase [Fistulina hepatica ATCC 64428]